MGGSEKNLIEKIDVNETKNLWEGVSRNFPNSQLKNKTFIPLFSAIQCNILLNCKGDQR